MIIENTNKKICVVGKGQLIRVPAERSRPFNYNGAPAGSRTLPSEGAVQDEAAVADAGPSEIPPEEENDDDPYLDDIYMEADVWQGLPLAETSSASRHRSRQTQRREQEEDSWERGRPIILERSIATEAKRLAIHAQFEAAESAIYTALEANYDGKCSRCGCTSSVELHRQKVHILGIYTCHQIEVRISSCSRCAAVNVAPAYSMDFADFGAFPATPVAALSLTSKLRNPDHPRVFFETRMLQLLSSLQIAQPQLSMETIAESLTLSYGAKSPLKADTLRKCLGKALEEFKVLQVRKEMPETYELVDTADFGDIKNTCPACAGANEEYADMVTEIIDAADNTTTDDAAAAATAAAAPSVQMQGLNSMNAPAAEPNALLSSDAMETEEQAADPASDPSFPSAAAAAAVGDVAAAAPLRSIRSGKDLLLAAQRTTGKRHVFMHSVHVDACFGLPHLRRAGSATLRPAPFRQYLADDARVKAFCENPRAAVTEDTGEECVEFRADSALGRTSDKYDFTGLFGAFCSHGFLLSAFSMHTGERWAYSTFALVTLLELGIIPMFWWYDINCRYKHHVIKYAADAPSSNLPVILGAWICRYMQYPLPVWHANMHNARCQSLNTHRDKAWAGRGSGEPTERAWAFFRPFGPITQYMSPAARKVTLEAAIVQFNSQKESSLLATLVRAFYRAHEHSQQHLSELNAARAALLEHFNSDGDAVDAFLACSPESSGSLEDVELPWQAEYVEAWLLHNFINATAHGEVSAELLLPSASHRLKKNGVAAKRADKTLQRLRREHPGETAMDWAPRQANYDLGLLALALHRMREHQESAQSLQLELVLVEFLFAGIYKRRKETKRLIDVKQNQVKKLKAALIGALNWSSVAVTVADRSPSLELEMIEAVQPARATLEKATNSAEELPKADNLLQDAKAGRFPWITSTTDAGASPDTLRVAAHAALDQFSRAQEQIKIIMAELRGIPRFYEVRRRKSNEMVVACRRQASELQSTLQADEFNVSQYANMEYPPHLYSQQDRMEFHELAQRAMECHRALIQLEAAVAFWERKSSEYRNKGAAAQIVCDKLLVASAEIGVGTPGPDQFRAVMTDVLETVGADVIANVVGTDLEDEEDLAGDEDAGDNDEEDGAEEVDY